MQAPTAIVVYGDDPAFNSAANAASFEGVDYGPRITQVRQDKSAMAVFETAKDVLVFDVPGHSYFAARWRQGYAPASWLVVQYGKEEPWTTGKYTGTRYSELRVLAQIPKRKGAQQTS